MRTVKVTERGWGGHFICASSCRYRRNTLLKKGEHSIVVSSVGNMHIDRKLDTVGHERYYETMAFRGHQDGPYIEAAVSCQISWPEEMPWGIFGKSLKDLPDDVDLRMDQQHDNIVAWMAEHFDEAYQSGAPTA